MTKEDNMKNEEDVRMLIKYAEIIYNFCDNKFRNGNKCYDCVFYNGACIPVNGMDSDDILDNLNADERLVMKGALAIHNYCDKHNQNCDKCSLNYNHDCICMNIIRDWDIEALKNSFNKNQGK